MKRKRKEIYLPFILLFFLMLFLHLFMNFIGDDLWFAKQLNHQSLIDFVSYRYFHWASRIIIEGNLVLLTRINVNIWRICDVFLYTLSAFIILKLVNKKKDKKIYYLGCLLFLIYPYADLSSAGWAATTMNYMWCFAFGLVSFLPLINKKVNKITYVVSILGLIYAINQEQMCAIVFGIHFLYFLYRIYKKEKINKYNILCFILSFLSLIFILTCPGNAVRTTKELAKWFPEFSKYGILQKTYFGIVSMINVLLENQIILLLFVTFLCIGTYIYSKKSFSKIIGIFTLIFVSAFTIFRPLLLNVFPVFENVFKIFQYQGIPSLKDKFVFLPFIFSCLLIVSIVYMLLVIFKEKNLLPTILFLIGVASRFIIGFSPTIFISGNRTAFFLSMAILVNILFIIYKLYEDKKIKKQYDIILKSTLLVLAVLNYLNIFISI